MNATADRPSSPSQVRPTLADLQRAQLQALRDGDRHRVARLQAAIFRRVESAQVDANDPADPADPASSED
jgi:hypothetical protein